MFAAPVALAFSFRSLRQSIGKHRPSEPASSRSAALPDRLMKDVGLAEKGVFCVGTYTAPGGILLRFR